MKENKFVKFVKDNALAIGLGCRDCGGHRRLGNHKG